MSLIYNIALETQSIHPEITLKVIGYTHKTL